MYCSFPQINQILHMYIWNFVFWKNQLPAHWNICSPSWFEHDRFCLVGRVRNTAPVCEIGLVWWISHSDLCKKLTFGNWQTYYSPLLEWIYKHHPELLRDFRKGTCIQQFINTCTVIIHFEVYTLTLIVIKISIVLTLL